ncbi:MAG: hypothetical protein ACI8QF_003627 [Limisphaerales bacterium]|jgi:hypothetical protein
MVILQSFPAPSGQPRGRRSAGLRRHRQRGALSAELAIAIAILVTGLFPLSVTIFKDQKRARSLYVQAIAMEIVDGEMEILAAGEWRNLETGEHPYSVTAAAAENLPDGRFTVSRDSATVELAWIPVKRGYGGPLKRELTLPKTP